MSNNSDDLNSYLFALRVSLQDTYNNESDIIRELKKDLLLSGTNSNEIDNSLQQFYQYYGIDIPLDTIQQVPIEDNIEFDVEYSDGSSDDDLSDNELQIQPPNIHSHFSIIQGLNHFINSLEENNDIIQVPVNQLFGLVFNGNQHIESNLMNNLEDIRITVDEKEINNLESKVLEDNLDTDCSICMANMVKDETIIKLKCSHVFHKECIETYLKQYNHKCPICRKKVGKKKYNF